MTQYAGTLVRAGASFDKLAVSNSCASGGAEFGKPFWTSKMRFANPVCLIASGPPTALA